MNCPYCQYHFEIFATNALSPEGIPSIAPCVCEKCGKVGLLEDGKLRQATTGEIFALSQSSAWKQVIEPVRKLIYAKKKREESRNN